MAERRAGAASRPEQLESRATFSAIAVFVATGVATAIVFSGRHVPLAGPGSIGAFAAWCAAGFGAVAFAASFIVEMRRGHAAWRLVLPVIKRVIDIVAMSLGMAMLGYLLVTAIAHMFQLGFRGMVVDAYGGGLLAGAAAAALAYIASLAGARVTTEGLAGLAVLVLFSGTMASMLVSADETWWQFHFSQLGNTTGATANRFNFALIIAGLVITALANYLGHDIEQGMRRRGREPERVVRLLSWLFAVIGLLMAVVGLVPDAVNFTVHVGAASGMVVVFAVFVGVMLRRVPGVPRDFIVFTGLVVVGIAVAIVLWIPIGYFNLTGMEFMSAGLLFAWLMVLVRMTRAYAAGGAEPDAPQA